MVDGLNFEPGNGVAIEALERTICSQSLPIFYHLFGLLVLPKCRCSSDEYFARFCPEPPWSLGIPNVFSRFLKDLRLSPFFSQYFQFFLKFYDFLRSFSNMSQGPSQISAFVARFQHTEPRVKGWPSQAEEGRTILEVSGSLGCALNSNEFVDQW